LLGAWRGQLHEDQPELDQNITSVSVGVARDLSPALTVNLNTTGTSASFEQGGGDYRDIGGAFGLEWRMSRHLVTTMTCGYAQRASDLIGSDFSEVRVWLTLAYRHGVPRANMLETEFAIDRQAGEN
jgi:hypothetical protein